MIIILGNGFIAWTGIFAGIFFILSFLTCRCFCGLCNRENKLLKFHRYFISGNIQKLSC